MMMNNKQRSDDRGVRVRVMLIKASVLFACSCVFILGVFLSIYKYVDMCDPINQGVYAVGCYYSDDKASCDVLESLQHSCKEDGTTPVNGWYKRKWVSNLFCAADDAGGVIWRSVKKSWTAWRRISQR